ncbi:hypothetical protein Clacol_002011 [Clathrus columnatus]|uniref:EKC/KEOPS complex subunit CGI121 n=1 Tax=Clathrus columnatus TaxID=1419009 RepID=A0AAV5A5C7_9AGAM|nr:hypothetical protein Clacol_002011 [Clathrus columnatus]
MRLEFAYLPDEISVGYIAFFTEVSNASEIKKRIQASFQLQGSEGEKERVKLNFAFIDAKAVSSDTHINAAVTQATLALSQNKMISRSLNTEIAWFLSPGKSIKDAIARYGVSDMTTTIITVKVGPPSLKYDEILQTLNEIILGKLASMDDVKKHADYNMVREYHHIRTGDQYLQLTEKKELDKYTDTIAISYTVAKSIVA